MAVIWAIVPLFNLVLFLFVPIEKTVPDEEKAPVRGLVRSGSFWLLMVMMICAGASEQGMSQWASAFAESGLGVSKTVGDILGPCTFALTMGTARAIFGKVGGKIPLPKFMAASSILCIFCYLLASLTQIPALGLLGCALCGFSVGILWPGTFSLAARQIPNGGTAMYAFLALGGDIGCVSGPTLVGLVADGAGGALKAGLLAAILFPILMLAGSLVTMKKTGLHGKKQR